MMKLINKEQLYTVLKKIYKKEPAEELEELDKNIGPTQEISTNLVDTPINKYYYVMNNNYSPENSTPKVNSEPSTTPKKIPRKRAFSSMIRTSAAKAKKLILSSIENNQDSKLVSLLKN